MKAPLAIVLLLALVLVPSLALQQGGCVESCHYEPTYLTSDFVLMTFDGLGTAAKIAVVMAPLIGMYLAYTFIKTGSLCREPK